jgi:hypothetical protein
VEQFAIVDSDLETSDKMQEEMIATAEEFYQSLGFPYHVINIVSGMIIVIIIIIILVIITMIIILINMIIIILIVFFIIILINMIIITIIIDY